MKSRTLSSSDIIDYKFVTISVPVKISVLSSMISSFLIEDQYAGNKLIWSRFIQNNLEWRKNN